MTWECLNPAEIAASLPSDRPVLARQIAEDMVRGRLHQAFRDGLNWADERMWCPIDPEWGKAPRPFNLSPLLPDDFEITDPTEMLAESERLLRDGQWERGWQLYEFRHQIEQGQRQMRRLFMPHWDGKSQCRRLLVHADQGAGDAIMFARYLAELDRRSIAWDFLVDSSLLRLMQTLFYRGRAIDLFDESLYDAHVPVESLPLALKMYEPMRSERYLSVMAAKPGRVGIVWSGQWFHPRNAQRSMTLEQILAHVPPGWTKVVSLQVGESRQQLRFAPSIADLGAGLCNWHDTAQVIAGLDLLVTVDTGIAHLAGAMGVPTKLVLKEPAEWRWGHAATTPWYDSVQIERIHE